MTAPTRREPIASSPPGAPVPQYERLRRIVLTDEVSRTLFEEYAAHRQSDRGTEEIGWVLLGVREADEATVVATLPAGANRDAGEAHIRFNSDAQALGCRIVRQADRRLTMLGVVHTHPGTLRHPSKGDLRGDRAWVPNLRGGEGVFGIGTTTNTGDAAAVGGHPIPQTQTLGNLRFDWYSLGEGDTAYRPMPVELVIGPDLAKPLRALWTVIEAHAARLDRLARQFNGVRWELGASGDGPSLLLSISLGSPTELVRVLLQGKSVRFFHDAGGELTQFDLPASTAPDHGVYLLLAELAARG